MWVGLVRCLCCEIVDEYFCWVVGFFIMDSEFIFFVVLLRGICKLFWCFWGWILIYVFCLDGFCIKVGSKEWLIWFLLFLVCMVGIRSDGEIRCYSYLFNRRLFFFCLGRINIIFVLENIILVVVRIGYFSIYVVL